MTAVVLAAGRGTRLSRSDTGGLDSPVQRDVAARGLKVMMPVGHDGRRWIDYVLDALTNAGCDDVVLVVPPDHADIEAHLAARVAEPPRVRVAVQSTPAGTAAAVLAAAAAVAAREFVVVNGDTIYPAAALQAVASLDGCGLGAFTRRSLQHDSGLPIEKIAAFALVERDAAWQLTGLREKPSPADLASLGDDALVSVNLWKMSRAIFEACRDVPPSPRGERELPDAVLRAVAQGTAFRVVAVDGRLFDLTTAADVPLASRGLASTGGRW